MTKVTQKWKCKTCGNTYKAAIPVREVMCGGSHFVKDKHMELVEGDPLPPRAVKKAAKTTTKKVAANG